MLRQSIVSRAVRTGCWVAAVLAIPAALLGNDESFTLQPIPPAPNNAAKTGRSTPSLSGLEPEPMFSPKVFTDPAVPPFRDSGLGAQHHLGAPDDGGVGYRHFDFPAYRYDIWYRPHAFGWGTEERCAPSPFRPRGYGNLFNESSSCYRMDYSRYRLKEYRSDYGPAYYRNLPDERCADGDWTQDMRPGCSACRQRETRVWTLGQHGQSGN